MPALHQESDNAEIRGAKVRGTKIRAVKPAAWRQRFVGKLNLKAVWPLLLIWLSPMASTSFAQSSAQLLDLPVPELGAEEPEVRAQMQSVRTELDALLSGLDLAQPGSADVALAAQSFAELGRLYYLYDLLELSEVALSNALTLSETAVGQHASASPRREDRLGWLYLRAVVRSLNALTEPALADFSRVLVASPENVPSLIRRGDLFYDSGRYEDANKDYREAARLDSSSAAAVAGLGLVAHRLGEHQTAVDLLRRALAMQPTADSLNYPLGQSLRSLGEMDAARAALRLNKQGRVQIDDPVVDGLGAENRSSLALYHAGNLAMRRGEMKEASSYYRRYLLRRPDHVLATHNLGLTLLAQQQRDEGLRALRSAVELDPEFRGGHYFLAAALAEDGDFEEALGHYRKAHEIDPLEQAIHADYATLLARMGRVREALSELEPVAKSDPDAHYLRLKYATVLSAAGRTAEAMPLFDELAADSMEPAVRGEALYHLAVDRLNRGDGVGARHLFQESLEVSPGLSTASAALAQLLARSGDYSGAVAHFARAVQAQPSDDRTQFGYAMTLLLLDRDQEARSALEAAVEVLPEHIGLRHILARVLAASSEKSVRDGERALVLAQQLMQEQASAEHAETLAMAFAEVGRFQDASEWQLRVVQQIEASGRGGSQLQLKRAQAAAFAKGQPARDPWEPKS